MYQQSTQVFKKNLLFFTIPSHILMLVLTNHSHGDFHEHFKGGRQIVHLVYSEYRY